MNVFKFLWFRLRAFQLASFMRNRRKSGAQYGDHISKSVVENSNYLEEFEFVEMSKYAKAGSAVVACGVESAAPHKSKLTKL
jgi:hypothetical protein